MRLALTLTASLLGAALLSAPASAMPAMPLAGVVANDAVDAVVVRRHRHLRYTGRTDRAYRAHRRANTYQHGNPNARNPERPGYAQQLGNTTNGPRY